MDLPKYRVKKRAAPRAAVRPEDHAPSLLAMIDVLDLAEQPVMLLRPDGEVVLATASAQEMLGEYAAAVCGAIIKWNLDQSNIARRVGLSRGVIRIQRDAERDFRITVGELPGWGNEGGLIAALALTTRRIRTRTESPLRRLTLREREVAELIGEGHSNKEIGRILGITLHTVKRHGERIFRKLGVHTRARLMAELRR